MPAFLGACRCLFQEVKLLVFRRHLIVFGGGGVIIHSLAFDDISGNVLQLDSGGGGGERLSWYPTGLVRGLAFVWKVVQLILSAGASTTTPAVFTDVPEGEIPGLALTNRRTRAHTAAGRVCNLSKS